MAASISAMEVELREFRMDFTQFAGESGHFEKKPRPKPGFEVMQ